MRTLKYSFSRILIRTNCIPEYFRDAYPAGYPATLITDGNVAGHHLKHIAGILRPRLTLRTIVLPAGEKTKSLKTAGHLYEKLLRINNGKPHLRTEPIIAFGGGMIGDLAGFVAATYMRGTPLVQIPASLMAQVDSSVGGKTAVNMPQGKNLVGAFYHPDAILIDPVFLKTLPEREFVSGFGEIIKYAIIESPALFEFLRLNREKLLRRDTGTLLKVILACVKIKTRIVEKDEKDANGIRARLNFGHTYGHAFETASGYGRYLHGEAVALGMLKAAAIAVRKKICPPTAFLKIKDLMESFGLPVVLPDIPPQKTAKLLLSDKKTVRDKLTLILPVRIGRVTAYYSTTSVF
ncbi:MAG: 3-dehydroquinate synthase [Planctomycetes bacterium]|nr:3-dehydroquinate synthase [Planctomycetota bacterium]